MSGSQKAAVGAGVAAAVAAAALGAYFLYGKDGDKNRKKVKGWMLKAKGEVLERLESMEMVSEESFKQVLDKVLANYRGARNVTSADLLALAADVRKHWNALKPAFKKAKAENSASRRGSSRRKTARSARSRQAVS